MKTQKPLVSMITVNYNGIKDTIQLIHSIITHIKSVNWEIIVIDNGSSNNEATLLKTTFQDHPNCKFFRSEINLGFAGGNNLAIPKAKGEYLFFINNDTFFVDDGIISLIERIETQYCIGAVSPKIKFNETAFPIQFAGYTQLSKYTMRNSLIGFGKPDNGKYDKPANIPYMHGAAMMISKATIQQVGEMPELYFLYYEELDWAERIKEAGYDIWYEPKCQIIHKESQTTGKESPLRTYYMARNRLLFAKRNFKALNKTISYIYQLAIALPKNYLVLTLRGQNKLANAHLKGVLDFLNHKFGKQW